MMYGQLRALTFPAHGVMLVSWTAGYTYLLGVPFLAFDSEASVVRSITR